jgi:hypothetical protein
MVKIYRERGEEIEGETLLDALKHARVFEVYKNDDGRFIFVDGCDNWYSVYLNRDQVLSLAKELFLLAYENKRNKNG